MTVQRGFPTSEYEARVGKAQRLMAEAGLAALLLTTEPEVRYFTGFLTRFWESPTRPWFLILPAAGRPVAVIPSIGAHLMGQSWITDIRTWRSPDYGDDGLSLLTDAFKELVPPSGKIGVPSALESHLRMPLSDYARLQDALGPERLVADKLIMRRLRSVKTDAEISKICHACTIADRSFARVRDIARTGVTLDEVFRRFQMLCLEEGADWVGYLAGGAGPGGYGDVITPAVSRELASGDVLMLDTGVVWDGYFCDFDRNYAVGSVPRDVDDAYARLIEATDAAFEIARPGATAADLFHAMDRIVSGGEGGSDAGRLGHGLGMQLTEWPSLIPQDDTVLEPGMVLTLEPGIEIAPGQTLVHEENIVVSGTGAEYLSAPAPRDLPRLM
ncbi:Xaa-Pro peptidase family protein [Roseobacter sp. YSTF-M11]|uniref:Xaa-Pro peptidase family protein n=1 Tax=Roseobacter insulae TaxID=2859783 RepID=A0A9X1K084_9RHOB|nr:Xaa-Pro peptidase family protein [Roseobacter insulae]MBW4710010.1 Xaa-Pro peptidase family protein [Roseobacter insulae]